MKRLLTTIALSACLLTGCAGLLIQEDDPGGDVVVKVLARTVLGGATLFWSEVYLAFEKDRLKREAYLEDYHAHMVRLANQGHMSMADAEWLTGQERARVEGIAAQDRALAASIMAQGLSQAGQAMQQGFTPASASPYGPPVHCTSTPIGRTVYTDCY